MASNIDPSKPTEVQATTESVRDNFQAAADEITELQTLLPGGGRSFNDYLDGYLDTGFHAGFAGDLDTVLHNSKFLVDAATVTNAPTDFISPFFGILLTDMFGGANEAIQTLSYLDPAGSIIYQRTRGTGVWGSWTKIVDNGAFPLRLDGYGDDGFHEEFTGDLDTITKNAQYFCFAPNVTNEPPEITAGGNRSFFLHSIRFDVDDGIQYCYGLGDATNTANKTWQRNQVAGVWSAWVLVVDGPVETTSPVQNPDGAATEYDFPIPEGSKEINIMFRDVTNFGGGGILAIEMGVGGVPQTTGYEVGTGSVGNLIDSNAHIPTADLINSFYGGNVKLKLMDPAANTWVVSGNMLTTGNFAASVVGWVDLSGVCNLIRVRAVGGPVLSAQGSISVSYK
jgi:hypothetical protein